MKDFYKVLSVTEEGVYVYMSPQVARDIYYISGMVSGDAATCRGGMNIVWEGSLALFPHKEGEWSHEVWRDMRRRYPERYMRQKGFEGIGFLSKTDVATYGLGKVCEPDHELIALLNSDDMESDADE